MSVQIGDTVHIRHCSWCEKQFKTTDSPRDEHCSHECFYKDRGEGALNQLASDHKICASCYRYIKSISKPEQSWLEEKADRVETALNHGGELTNGPNGQLTLDARFCSNTRHTDTESIIGYQHPTPETDYLYGNSGKWICSCGNVEVHEHDDILANLDIETTITLLLARLRDLYYKGAIRKAPTESVFFEAFDTDKKNWKHAVGKALHSGQ